MKKCLIAIVALTLCALGCQPTPEVDAVKQKDTNVLIDTVRTEEKEQQEAAVTLPPVKEQFPARFICDFTTAQKNVHVVSDVPLDILTDGTFPTLRVERRTLSDEERMTVAKRVFGTDELYIFEEHVTRKDLEELIKAYMHEFTPEEKAEWMRDMDADEEEYARMLERRKEELERFQKQYNELPTDDSRVPLSRWDGSAPEYAERTGNSLTIVKDAMPEGYKMQQDQLTVYADEMDRPFDYCVAWRNDTDATWAGGFDNTHKFGTAHIEKADYDTPHEGATVTPNDAIRLVQGLFSGVADIAPVGVYWANSASTDGEEVGVNANTRWAYLIRFSQNFNGAYAPYCTSFSIDYESEAGFARIWRNEMLAAVVDGEGNLVSFDWFAPLKVTETIAESTPLLPYEEIEKTFETQMDRVFFWEDHQDGTLTVNSVQLGLFRIREQNDMEHGLMVPVWFFTGTFEYSQQKQASRTAEGFSETQAAREYYDDLNPLCIINAIDGSIIDPMKGY